MLIISCSHGKIGKKIANSLKIQHFKLVVKKFPDNELYVRLPVDVKNKFVILVQSFYGNIAECFIEVLFAAKTIKELGAKKVMLIAPYFPYFRQDKRFKSGECVSIEVIADIINKYFDYFVVIDPHLHRERRLKDIFKIKATRLTTTTLIADYIKRHVKNPIIIGPDEESSKLISPINRLVKTRALVLKKKRFSAEKVKIYLSNKISFENKTVVIVDDIISTGHTLLETIKVVKKLAAKKIICICVHGIFSKNAYEKLRKHAKIISTNTIPHKTNKIDITKIICNWLKKKKNKRAKIK